MQNNEQVKKPIVPGYGTKEEPLSIDQARAKVREDFLKLAEIVMSQVSLPPGHGYRNTPALGLESQLRWAGCEVEASEYGLSIHAGLVPGDCNDKSQLLIEVRYFHPELHFRDGRRKAQVSRRYNDCYSAHLWVEQGRPFWGQHVSLIQGNEFCRDFTSIESLAESIVDRLKKAIEARKPVSNECAVNTAESEALA